MPTPAPFGRELVLDVKTGLGEHLLASESLWRALLAKVVAAAGMTAWGPPMLKRLDERDGDAFPGNETPKGLIGWSAVQFIHTSSVVVHACECTGEVYVNLFSCKPFDEVKVVEAVVEALGGSASVVRRVSLSRHASA